MPSRIYRRCRGYKGRNRVRWVEPSSRLPLSDSKLVHIAPYLDGWSARGRHAAMRSMRRSCSVKTHRLHAPLNSRASDIMKRRSDVRAALAALPTYCRAAAFVQALTS
eukprot:5552894-Prymnesium_polylepis.1